MIRLNGKLLSRSTACLVPTSQRLIAPQCPGTANLLARCAMKIVSQHPRNATKHARMKPFSYYTRKIIYQGVIFLSLDQVHFIHLLEFFHYNSLSRRGLLRTGQQSPRCHLGYLANGQQPMVRDFKSRRKNLASPSHCH